MAEYIEREKITEILETAIDLQGAVMLMLRAEEDPAMKGERKAYKDILILRAILIILCLENVLRALGLIAWLIFGKEK